MSKTYYLKVKFPGSCREYHYLSEKRAEKGDYVVTQRRQRDVPGIATVISCSTQPASLASRYVVQVVDLDNFYRLEKEYQKKNEIRKKLEAKRKAFEQRAVYDMMAVADPEVARLLRELDS